MVYKQLLHVLLIFSLGNVVAQVSNKDLKKNYAVISDKLYAGKYEVSNVQYRHFLEDLKKQNKHEEWIAARVDAWGWTPKKGMYNEKMRDYYHLHPAYDLHPVVNISRAAAQAYCDWLTESYQNNPKRTHQKVLFRLPTLEEWQQAAHGSDSISIYPWKGDFFFTTKMHHRCNVKKYYEQLQYVPFEEKYTEYIFTTKSFEANSIGLYNMGGNVSEMVSDAAITKGGSWMDDSYFAQIAVSQPYDLEPHPSVGFRVFMEIIEP
jgi:formylglycine-generating enzyme required for sulfatase activity